MNLSLKLNLFRKWIQTHKKELKTKFVHLNLAKIRILSRNSEKFQITISARYQPNSNLFVVVEHLIQKHLCFYPSIIVNL